MLNRISGGLGQVNPALGDLVGKFAMATTAMGAWKASKIAVEAGLSTLKHAFIEVKAASDLDVSVSFLRQMEKAADMAGESVDEAKHRVLLFQQVLAAAAEGNKEALEKLGRVGIKDPTGKTMEENLREVAKGFANITDKAQQAKLAVDLFGKGSQTSMPDILGEIGNTRGNRVLDEAAAINAAGWKSSKRFWNNTAGALWRGVKDTGSYWSARVLEGWGVEAEVNEPSKLQKTESPEARAQREAKAKKYADDLAAAKKDYARAVSDGYTTEQKAIEAGLKVINIRQRLTDTSLNELERTKLQTELLKEQARYNELNKQLADQRKATDEKRLNYERQLTELQRQQKEIEADRARALRDRSAWTLGEVAGLGQKFTVDTDGLPILPEDMLQSIERALGRSLSNREIQDMRSRAGNAIGQAGEASNFESAAHWMQLLGFGDMAGTFANNGLKIRKTLGALSSQEQDPMMGFAKEQKRAADAIDELNRRAAGEGIKIRPVMGK